MAIHLNDSLNPKTVMAPVQFDIDSVAGIKEQFEELLQEPNQLVVIDLKATEFIDSSGIGAIIFLFKRLKRQQRVLQLADVHGQPKRILTMLKVDKAIAFTGEQS
ncbi:anti-anti-sigma factor [Ferrimonas sediminum]|uniref:Anti-anti-sigma factor n=1 Tax=Ferrimonas sediminum TaxID=718193 RepID=A0A1G8S6Y2_9GAMM|nr:STAS domain-containing protein [Ferrimonas sediminum]SDJ24957.1 anti-anti-sigma factor [Ferrimonas sediminum]